LTFSTLACAVFPPAVVKWPAGHFPLAVFADEPLADLKLHRQDPACGGRRKLQLLLETLSATVRIQARLPTTPCVSNP
jgi:hypothetical protein